MDQKKQQILNYQIKVIQQCSDSLFTDMDCDHHRYLSWELYENIREIIKDQAYAIRWIGNSQEAYIFAYSYVIIVGCSTRPALMTELKTILYQMAKQYLPIFQQKMLIQFLCLIEYSQDKYIFFRKYPKIQTLLIKIFQQIQERQPIKLSNSEQTQFKKLADQRRHPIKFVKNLASPGKSEITNPSTNNFLRNTTDYWSLQKSQKNFRKSSSKIQEQKNFRVSKPLSYKWYETYNKHFSFMKMEFISPKFYKLEIMFSNQNEIHKETSLEDFIIATQKDCFFVIELETFKNKLTQYEKQRYTIQEQSISQSKDYLNQLISKELKESLKKNVFQTSQQKRTDQVDKHFTPKFATQNRKLSFASSNFYEDNLQEKVCSIQVLEVKTFEEESRRQSRKVFNYVTPNNINSEQNFDSPYNINHISNLGYPSIQKIFSKRQPAIQKNKELEKVRSCRSTQNHLEKIFQNLNQDKSKSKTKSKLQSQIHSNEIVQQESSNDKNKEDQFQSANFAKDQINKKKDALQQIKLDYELIGKQDSQDFAIFNQKQTGAHKIKKDFNNIFTNPQGSDVQNIRKKTHTMIDFSKQRTPLFLKNKQKKIKVQQKPVQMSTSPSLSPSNYQYKYGSTRPFSPIIQSRVNYYSPSQLSRPESSVNLSFQKNLHKPSIKFTYKSKNHI